MDNDQSNLDIAFVAGNNTRIRTGCSGQSNNKAILCLALKHLNLEFRYAARKKELIIDSLIVCVEVMQFNGEFPYHCDASVLYRSCRNSSSNVRSYREPLAYALEDQE